MRLVSGCWETKQWKGGEGLGQDVRMGKIYARPAIVVPPTGGAGGDILVDSERSCDWTTSRARGHAARQSLPPHFDRWITTVYGLVQQHLGKHKVM